MKRLLVFVIVLLALTAPVLSQPSLSDPAAYLPGDIPAYLEIRTDQAGLTALEQLMRLRIGLSGSTLPANSNSPELRTSFPLIPFLPSDINFQNDLLPWLGNRLGIGILNFPLGGEAMSNAAVIVLPIRDTAAAQAFVTKVSASTTATSVGGVSVYKTDRFGLAVGSDVIWLSSPSGIDALLKNPMLQRLTDNPQYQKVRAALPADAVVSAYVSGSFLTNMRTIESLSVPSLNAFLQAALRLHPAQSAMKDALLKLPNLDGIGVALQVSANRVDVTAALSLDAQYPAPTLTTATAGTALLNLIPANSFAVLDSYDPTLLAVPVAGLSYLGSAIGGIYDNITTTLESGAQTTESPTATPLPAPAITADSLVALAQPTINQAESMMGMSLEQLYPLIAGEYAVAVFPGVGPTIGEAFYLQSSNPQQLINTLDHVSKLVLTNPTTGAQWVTPTQSTIEGVNVTLLTVQGIPDRPALGIVNGNVLFLTLESTLPQVIDAAKSGNSATAALNWRDAFGSAQEAFFYADPRTIDLYSLRQQRFPPLPITALSGSLDLRDNGLFVLDLSAATAS